MRHQRAQCMRRPSAFCSHSQTLHGHIYHEFFRDTEHLDVERTGNYQLFLHGAALIMDLPEFLSHSLLSGITAQWLGPCLVSFTEV